MREFLSVWIAIASIALLSALQIGCEFQWYDFELFPDRLCLSGVEVIEIISVSAGAGFLIFLVMEGIGMIFAQIWLRKEREIIRIREEAAEQLRRSEQLRRENAERAEQTLRENVERAEQLRREDAERAERLRREDIERALQRERELIDLIKELTKNSTRDDPSGDEGPAEA